MAILLVPPKVRDLTVEVALQNSKSGALEVWV